MKVRIKEGKSASGPGGNYPGSTPYQNTIIEVTPQNADFVDDLLRGGIAEPFGEKQIEVIRYRDADEAPPILSNSPKTGKRSGKRDLQSEGG